MSDFKDVFDQPLALLDKVLVLDTTSTGVPNPMYGIVTGFTPKLVKVGQTYSICEEEFYEVNCKPSRMVAYQKLLINPQISEELHILYEHFKNGIDNV